MTTPAYKRRRHADPEDSQAHVHRRATDSDAVLRLHDRVDDHDRKFADHDSVIGKMAENLQSLNLNLSRVADVLEALNNVKGFWLTLRLISGAAKVVLPIAIVIGAVWAFAKTGQWSGTP